VSPGQRSHVAVVTGANHGIGAATAVLLAARGYAVLATYLRVHDEPDPGVPERYRTSRAGGPEAVLAAVEAAGGRAVALEADLTDAGAPARILDLAERELGPVDVLVNNATGWVQDTFRPAAVDRLGRSMRPVSAATYAQQFAVDAMAPALLIAEFARRHVARGATWGRIVGLTSGGPDGFPDEVSYGAAKAAQENYTMSAATELAEYGITANLVHPPVTDSGWVTDAVREMVATSPGLTHVASVEQVAEVVAWLVSDAGALVSGNVLKLR
jgi:3-oxoacyl-[acyl-carrier protein] reductase